MPLDEANPQPLGRAHLSHRRPTNLDRFHFGVVYYPEHWDAETRRHDAERMQAAGVNIVRMAEFAWDLMEPEEGRYDFTIFDETINHLGRHGISTILCTPTATPPRWLTAAHPQILRENANGVPMVHGSRQHCCHMNPLFRQYSRAITRTMADHLQDNPHVVGWQTDNEMHCHFAECHCDACQTAFQRYLRRKFANDVGALNRTWGTQFWSQTYDRFEDINTPRDNKPTYLNPAHHLDYFRYLTDGLARFQHDQVEILRATRKTWWITHNGLMQHTDYRGLFTQDLDFLGYDAYPMFVGDPVVRTSAHALSCDRVRALSGNFIVPEHQSNFGGQPNYMLDTPEPGEMRQLTMVTIARGADSLLYFRWRTCRFGAEEYWGGIIDHDNVPRRRYKELAQIGRDLQRIGPEIIGTSVFIDIAIASGDQDVADAHTTYHLGLPADGQTIGVAYAPFFHAGYAIGCVHPADDLTGIKIYIIPQWALFHPAWIPNLERFVAGGGTLVIGARTATRDGDNNVVAATLPGCLRPLAGATVEEYGRQNQPDKRPLDIMIPGGKDGETALRTEWWYEALGVDPGTEVHARWRGRHLDGQPAITVRKHEQGRTVYVGTYLTESLVKALLPWLTGFAHATPLWHEAPAGVQVVRRESPGKQVWFFTNHTDGDLTIPTTPAGVDLTTGAATGGALTLGRYGVAVIKS